MWTDKAFGVQETHGILWQPTNAVTASSDGLGWQALYASAQREQPYEASFRGVQDHLVILHLDGPVGVCRRLGGAQQRRVIGPGGLFILPGGVDFGVRLEGSLDSVHVYLRDAVLREVAAELLPGDPDRFELVPRLGEDDAPIRRLLLTVRAALTDPAPAGALGLDHLARAIAARLLSRHAAALRAFAAPRDASRLDVRLSRALACMEANLSDTLTLADLARAAGLSQAQFVRRFRAALGATPHQHLIGLRVGRARDMLRSTREPIAQVALACGFAHQEHLTRTFTRRLGVTPASYRRATRA
jgi:AraC family transcriptional regulator